MKTSTFGLKQNWAAALCYLGGWITGIIFLVAERRDKVVRFHALQSILWFLPLSILKSLLWIVLSLIRWVPLLGPAVSGLIMGALGLLTFASALILILMAWQGKEFMIPIIGTAAKRQVDKE
jgi:uncharacterized membrane protein